VTKEISSWMCISRKYNLHLEEARGLRISEEIWYGRQPGAQLILIILAFDGTPFVPTTNNM
jgi:hypothetical protein